MCASHWTGLMTWRHPASWTVLSLWAFFRNWHWYSCGRVVIPYVSCKAEIHRADKYRLILRRSIALSPEISNFILLRPHSSASTTNALPTVDTRDSSLVINFECKRDRLATGACRCRNPPRTNFVPADDNSDIAVFNDASARVPGILEPSPCIFLDAFPYYLAI